MTSLAEQFTQGVDRLANIVGHFVLRAVLVLATAVVVVGMSSAMGLQDHAPPVAAPAATPAAPVAPAAPECTPQPGQLFNPCAVLDTSHIDDERSSLANQCLQADGVTMPDGTCVEATYIWRSEVAPAAWEQLRYGYGFPVDLDDHDRLIVPAGWVVLDNDTVTGLDLGAPVQPILL